MKEINYTDEQLKAITITGKNLLVSAAAGSGKTAVLVERIIRRLMLDKTPIDIDRILVMTFTRAAADQMREKIHEAITERRLSEPEYLHLQKQEALVHTAHISTIHGFCLEILRNHFSEAEIEPDFRVADEGELHLMQADVLDEILEEAYEEADPDFISLSETVAMGKNDKKLEETVLKLADYALSHPDPNKWLENAAYLYKDVSTTDCGNNDEESTASLSDHPIVKSLFRSAQSEISEILSSCERLLDFVNNSETLSSYAPTVDADIAVLKDLYDSNGYFDLANKIRNVKFVTLGYNSEGKKVKTDIKPEGYEKEYATYTRNKIKDMAGSVAAEMSKRDEEAEREILVETAPAVAALTYLVRRYLERYSEKKRKANILDFNDLEHLAIKVLKSNEGAVAAEYKELFEEIYVDEYQDSNLVQEELINLVSRGNNVFMVGDVKQSIYSFRMARPEMFMEKYERFSEGFGNENEIVDLKHNFRSRHSVIDSVNEVFSEIMHRESGMIEYNENQKLVFGFEDYTEDRDTDKTELILINKDAELDSPELEATVIADRIKALKNEKKVYDTGTKTERELKYGDIAIIFRNFSDADTYRMVLEENNIPVHLISDEGYFESEEIALLLDFLRIIDNPGQDIPLAAVLRSYFCKMTDEELAIIRSIHRNVSLYESIKITANDTEKHEEFNEEIITKYNNTVIKSNDFITRLSYYRNLTGYTSVYDILAEIIGAGYGDYLLTKKNGRKKLANVEMLLKKAEDYAKTSYKGLFQFIRYIDKLKKYEIDYGQANLTDENDNAVRLMTIHKSKGLEFPVCIIANTNRKYNESDIYADILPDMDYGIGMSHMDYKKRTRTRTLIKQAIKKKKLAELKAEEIRILYVAMTRAREKLIMTAVCRDTEKELNKARQLFNARSFLDLLLFARSNSPLRSIDVEQVSIKDIVSEHVKQEIFRDEAVHRLNQMIDAAGTDDYIKPEERDYYELLTDRLNYKYKKSDTEESYRKYSVTELKQKHIEEALKENKDIHQETYNDEMFPESPENDTFTDTIPAFMKEKTAIPATLHGTAVHRLFEIWDYDAETDMDNVKGFIVNAINRGLIDKTLADSVAPSEIYDFVNSDLAARMRKADKKDLLYREQPFVIELDGNLIQGIIDAYFIEDDEIVVVDYKTDRVNESKTLVDRYELQLDYYARALERILGQRVKEKIIYSTALVKGITL